MHARALYTMHCASPHHSVLLTYNGQHEPDSHPHTHTHTHTHARAPARTHECIHKRNTVIPLSRAQVFEKVAQDNPTTPQSFLDIGTCLLNIGNTVTTDQSVAAYTHSLASFTQVCEYM